MSEKAEECEPNEGSCLRSVLFGMCSVELVIRTRIGEAEAKLSRSAIMNFNKTVEEITSDLPTDLIHQLNRAIEWHLSEWQSLDHPADLNCQGHKIQPQ
ncbi:hypothetical protein [Klebsiella pneumoniae]|uniref:hypothetical protein n=1 Tax=Klebsiella pneumoniae TaxID=573 RepID=UPI00115983D6|nr:hypothetical protein [Klebsiella pneumoniae]